MTYFPIYRHDYSYLQLFSVYDFLFVQCFVVPLFMAAWWGAWRNFDSLFDKIIFNEDTKLSSVIVLIIGVAGGILVLSLQVEIRHFSTNGGV